DNDPQGATVFKWYRADDAFGLNETAISGATSVSYMLTAEDNSKYLRFAVIPAALTGATPGAEVKATSFLAPALSCGASAPLSVNHQVSGGVAPVNKSTVYATATAIPGEPAKCWISQNLGASQQAASVDDATEASAGWYWQFNRKQGYKHDGTTRTPNTTWINSINENTDWQLANDPCTLELGSLWRLPTVTEWNNLDNGGSWANWSDPFASDLKLHAAGFLSSGNGSLNNRGQNGYFWSSNQSPTSAGWDMSINSGGSNTDANNKADGFSVRCVRDCAGVPVGPTAGTHTASLNQIIWFWNAVTGATGYKWNTVNDYTTATDMAAATTKTETGLTCNTSYTRYVWAYNGCGNSGSTTLVKNTLGAPSAPACSTNQVSFNQIIWNWNTVIGAAGYKWNTVNDYSSATDMGTATIKTETGLSCNTVYARYVWAYNSCGSSSVSILTQLTQVCCGQVLTINHTTSGGAAPVNKNTLYFTVTNIPGELSKCWLTSNLGSDHQATAVSDATEASAGWYWQFNLKQGYMHDGTTRTPNTTWITNINETSDWITANDPCNIELGTTWRIPTYTEWYNVDDSGGWTNLNGPWGSGLNLHAGGFLNIGDGSLTYRGSIGNFLCSTQASDTNGWTLGISSTFSNMFNLNKVYGFSARCLRDN
ncbi:MAG: hypothetical protein ACOYNC_11355, partial [Bacteroidales bacterium]